MGSMAGLRRGATALNNSKGGSKRNVSMARWKPPKMPAGLVGYLTPDETRGTQVAEPIVFMAADYIDVYQTHDENNQPLPGPVHQPAYRFRSHTVPATIKPKNGQAFQKFVDLICSSGIDQHAPQPCLGCYFVDHGEDISARDQWAMNVAHLGWYHEVPLVRDGQIQMKRDGKGPVMVKNECQTHRMLNQVYQRMDQATRGKPQARPCEGCQQQAPFVWGDQRVVQVGKNQINNILAFNDQLGNTCANCGTGIMVVAYTCSRCNEDILDVASSGWTNAQIDQFSKVVSQCRACGNIDRPVPAYECGIDLRTMQPVAGGCPENVSPRPLDIFDVVVWVQREGESTTSALVVKYWMPIQNFRMPDGRLSGFQDGRPLADALKEIVAKPFDLKAMYTPLSLDEQAKQIQRQNPFVAAAPAYSAYGAAPQGYGPPGYPPPGAPGTPGYGAVPTGALPGQAPAYQPPYGPPPQQMGPPPPQQQAWQPQPQPGQAPAYPPVPPGGQRPNYGS